MEGYDYLGSSLICRPDSCPARDSPTLTLVDLTVAADAGIGVSLITGGETPSSVMMMSGVSSSLALQSTGRDWHHVVA